MNALVSVARAAIRGLIGEAQVVISTGLKNPGMISAAAGRLGLKAGADLQAVLRSAAANKISTALVLWEIGAEAYPMLRSLADADPQVADLLTTLEAQDPDKVSDTAGVGDISRFAEEFRALSMATAIAGSWDRLEALRFALAVDAPTRALYLNVKAMGRGL